MTDVQRKIINGKLSTVNRRRSIFPPPPLIRNEGAFSTTGKGTRPDAARAVRTQQNDQKKRIFTATANRATATTIFSVLTLELPANLRPAMPPGTAPRATGTKAR